MNNLKNVGKVVKIEENKITFELLDELNIGRLKTIFEGYEGDRIAEIFFKDPRSFTAQQRAFTFALLGDIYKYTGEPLESLKDVFYWQFRYYTGRTISLSDMSNNTVDDIATLDDLILDFIFENNIPFKDGYEIPQQNVQYYFYKCITSRVCCICGKTGAEIDHFDKALGRRSRKKVDHSEYTFAALCPQHHQEKHNLGVTSFKNKYKVKGIKLNQETIKKMRIDG